MDDAEFYDWSYGRRMREAQYHANFPRSFRYWNEAIAAYEERHEGENDLLSVARDIYPLFLEGTLYADHDRATELLGRLRRAISEAEPALLSADEQMRVNRADAEEQRRRQDAW